MRMHALNKKLMAKLEDARAAKLRLALNGLSFNENKIHQEESGPSLLADSTNAKAATPGGARRRATRRDWDRSRVPARLFRVLVSRCHSRPWAFCDQRFFFRSFFL